MLEVNGVKIGKDNKPYIIAELSANHGGDIERARNSIKAAKEAGVSAVKMQTYSPDTMTLDTDKKDFQINEGLWKGFNLYQLYSKAYTPFDWHSELFNYANEIGVTLFSTPFDESAVDLLERLGAPAFKIASFEITDLPLVKYVAKKKKPMFISTGMSDAQEIASALEICRSQGVAEILLFHCISNYPTELKDSRLGDIKYLETEFGVDVGLSDHTITNDASVLAIALGASAIEKHFKLDNEECGPDSSFSVTPDQLSKLVRECNSAWEAIKSDNLKRSEKEIKNKIFRRSIYFSRKLSAGHILTSDDIRRVRPGYGLEPKYFDKIVGMKITRDVDFAEPVSWNCLTKD
tara:strand:- start:168 stop:1214 length:1047 start_codon:yes stop_codon:yes gene_type:complete